MVSDRELRLIYGNAIAISRKGAFALVHLDRPSAGLIRQRTNDFDPATFFFDHCPFCQMIKDAGVLIFDDSILEEDDFMDE